MMGRFSIMYVLLIITIFTIGVSGKGALDPGQEVAVQTVFREMLKIQPPPARTSQDEKKPHIIPPRHMLELYRKYASGAGPRKMTGNTVRSIVPSKGFDSRTGMPIPTSELLTFNVTCISPSEEVHLAQLHLHRRRLARHQHWPSNRRVLAPPYRVRLYQLGGRGGRTTQLASVPVPHATRGGWHALDITPVLRELLLSNIQGPQLLGVRFEAPKGRQVSPAHFLKEPNNDESGNSPAFLVVFSEDSPDNGIADDGSETHVRLVPPHTHAIVEMIQTAQSNLDDIRFSDESIFQQTLVQTENRTDDDFYIESSDSPQTNEIDSNHRHKHKLWQHDEGENNELETDLSYLDRDTKGHSDRRHHENLGSILSNKIEDPSPGPRRVIRSILDNELPDADAAPTKSLPRTSPETVLTGRSNQKHKQKHSTIPLPPGTSSGAGKRARGNRKRKGRGRKKGEHKKRQRHRSNDDKENEWQPELKGDSHSRNNSASLSDGDVSLCERKKMVVNFADIGWDDFIVAPIAFEAYYCAGSCHFPLKNGMKPTNHATIQSMVHIQQPDIPAPCCVPNQLSSISMLFLDSSDNVVLKNYADMAVKSCACR